MSFNRNALPDVESYYTTQGLTFRERRGQWRTTGCVFHNGSDSMRINIHSGAFVCMAGCGARGGDVLAYHMALYGMDFITAAKSLGGWVDDGKPTQVRPTAFPPRDALALLANESNIVAIAAGNVAQGVVLTQEDRRRLVLAAGRIQAVVEVFV